MFKFIINFWNNLNSSPSSLLYPLEITNDIKLKKFIKANNLKTCKNCLHLLQYNLGWKHTSIYKIDISSVTCSIGKQCSECNCNKPEPIIYDKNGNEYKYD